MLVTRTAEDTGIDSPTDVVDSSEETMAKKGKKRKKWPGLNHEVDLPKEHVGMFAAWKSSTPQDMGVRRSFVFVDVCFAWGGGVEKTFVPKLQHFIAHPQT